ncbi:plasmid mobilization protein [Dechloromonas hortensis]|uniref:plasmid mobilization protein n=1 Tax=Dechloromonas hortensis TaxID=337779 RepID=UPI0012914CE3|nr:hypothetical protein [Dechloromonas hortensis]
MAGKKLSARCTDEQYLRIVRDAETIGVTVSEFVVTAALNIGARTESGAMESAALSAILERLDDLESRLGNPAPGGAGVSSNTPQDGPGLNEIGEAMADLYAGQKRTQTALERTDETLKYLVASVGKIFDHLARSAAPPAAPRPAPAPTPPAEPKAETFRRCRPGTVFDEYRETDEQPRPEREDFYRRNLQRIVDAVGWDSNVKPDQYAWAGMTPPPGLYNQ